MAVQQQLGAVLAQHLAKLRRIMQLAEAAHAGDRRVMDQDDAEQLLLLQRGQSVAKPCELLLAEPSGRRERQRRHRGGQSDQRHLAAPAHERKRLAGVAAHVVAPILRGAARDGADIGVVVAGHERRVVRRGQARRAMPAPARIHC